MANVSWAEGTISFNEKIKEAPETYERLKQIIFDNYNSKSRECYYVAIHEIDPLDPLEVQFYGAGRWAMSSTMKEAFTLFPFLDEMSYDEALEKSQEWISELHEVLDGEPFFEARYYEEEPGAGVDMDAVVEFYTGKEASSLSPVYCDIYDYNEQ